MILWHVFMDAHSFFLTTIDLSGDLPKSNLRVAHGIIETTMISDQVNVPYDQLLGGMKTPDVSGSGSGSQDHAEQAQYSGGSGNAPVGKYLIACPDRSRQP
jgi:hypothetical protein